MKALTIAMLLLLSAIASIAFSRANQGDFALSRSGPPVARDCCPAISDDSR